MANRVIERELTEADAIDAETTAYTLKSQDEDAVVLLTSGSAVNLTVPPDGTKDPDVAGKPAGYVFPIGAEVRIIQGGAGVVTVVAGAGVTLHSLAAKVALAGQYAEAKLRKTAANVWHLSGNLA